MLKLVISLLLFLLLFRFLFMMLRGLSRPLPEPPPPGELRKVDLTFRCPACGTEVRMRRAVEEDPAPPRHCMDDMELVKRADE